MRISGPCVGFDLKPEIFKGKNKGRNYCDLALDLESSDLLISEGGCWQLPMRRADV